MDIKKRRKVNIGGKLQSLGTGSFISPFESVENCAIAGLEVKQSILSFTLLSYALLFELFTCLKCCVLTQEVLLAYTISTPTGGGFREK